MRISYWSSDVCSSDLDRRPRRRLRPLRQAARGGAGLRLRPAGLRQGEQRTAACWLLTEGWQEGRTSLMAMSFDPAARAEAFRALHNAAGAFVIPNPWDVGSARLLASLGFTALATTSAGFAYSPGTSAGPVSRAGVHAPFRAHVHRKSVWAGKRVAGT